MVFERQRRRVSQQSRHNSGRSIFQRQYLSDEEEKAFRNRPIPGKNFDYSKLLPDAPYTPPVQEKAGESSAVENEAVIQEKSEDQPNRTGLPDRLKTGVENLSGYSLDDVRVHYNSPKPAQLQALAYTQGTDIHVAPGQVKHLPHETWHVVQQMQGRVQPTMQMKGVQINDDQGLEKEADVMGGKAFQYGKNKGFPLPHVREMVNNSTQGKQSAQLQTMAAQISARQQLIPSTQFRGWQSSLIQLHKGANEEDPTLDSMIIYKVIRTADDKVVYVGQTEESVGIQTRFAQHLLVHSTWSKATHKIQKVEHGDWTRFETDCAEQYWIDHFGGKDELENEKNQVSRSRFERICKDQEANGVTLFRGTEIGFPKGWKPKQ